VQAGRSPIMAKITPKVIADFDNPRPSLERFVDYYRPLLDSAGTWVWIWATGNADHVLAYPGPAGHGRNVSWARYSNYQAEFAKSGKQGWCSLDNFCAGPFWVIREDALSYAQIREAIAILRDVCAERGCRDVRVLEYFDPGPEFCESEFKYDRHPEVLTGWTRAIDVRARLQADRHTYARYPQGIPEGLPVRDFCAAQAAAYCDGMGFDGVYLGNQFGTREWWDPKKANGYSDAEAGEILAFFRVLKEALGPKRLSYWMDTYWEVQVERDRWSVPVEAYACLDGIVCSAWSVIITGHEQVRRNVESKLSLPHRPTIFFQVDHLDPWYRYNAIDYLRPRYLKNIEMFFAYAPRVDGLKFQANDEWGRPVPRPEIDLLLAALAGKPFPGDPYGGRWFQHMW
jgi:hypothetical protein